jgi:hypothetical protein
VVSNAEMMKHPSRAPQGEAREELADRAFLDGDDDTPDDTPPAGSRRFISSPEANDLAVSADRRPRRGRQVWSTRAAARIGDRGADRALIEAQNAHFAEVVAELRAMRMMLAPPHVIVLQTPSLWSRISGVFWHLLRVVGGVLAMYGAVDLFAMYWPKLSPLIGVVLGK